MIVRKMQPADVEQVAEIERQCFSMPWSENSFHQSLQIEDTLFLVVQSENQVIAYCGIYISFDEGEITNVAVAPSHRRKGVAEQLLKELQTQLLQRNVKRIVLEVRESNAPAIRLYEKQGFHSLGIRKDFYEKPIENAVIMEKNYVN